MMFKLRFSFIIVLTLLVSSSFSQDSTYRNSSVSVHLSMNASRVTGTTFYGINKVGLYAGITYRHYTTGDQFGWEIDFSYSQKGALKPPNHKKFDYTKYLMKLQYAQAQWFLNKSINDFTFEAGLGGAYLLSSSETDENGQNITGNGDFSTIEVLGSIGARLPITDRILIGFRLSHSIVPIRKHVNGATFRFNRGQYNQLLSFMLLYTIWDKQTVLR